VADNPASETAAPRADGLSRRATSRAAVVVGWSVFFIVLVVTAIAAPLIDDPTRRALLPVLLSLIFASGLNLSVGGLLGIDAAFDKATPAAVMAWQLVGVFVGVWLLTFAPLMRVHFFRMLS
jgi:hypothetical protein